MNRPYLVKGLIRLTRYQDYFATVTFTTILGMLFSGAHLSWASVSRFLLVLSANLLAVCFAYMINDIEDAPDDALTKSKAVRNPVSAGLLSYRAGYIASFGVAATSILLFYWLGPIPFWMGIATLVIAALYSWRWIRLKSIPGLDLLSHCLMLAGLQLGCAYFTFVSYHGVTASWVMPFLFVASISIYGELFNEVRDLEGDRKAGVTHTVAVMGEEAARILMGTVLAIAVVTVFYGILVGLIPLWFMGVLGILSLLLLIRPILKSNMHYGVQSNNNLHQSVVRVSTYALLIWMAVRFFGG